jgi:hypothetical protein
MQSSSRSLGGVLDHRYSLFIREHPHTNHVSGISIQVRHHDRVDTAPNYVAYGTKVGTQRRGIYVVEPHVNSCSDSGGSEIDAGVGGIRDRSPTRQDSSQREDER